MSEPGDGSRPRAGEPDAGEPQRGLAGAEGAVAVATPPVGGRAPRATGLTSVSGRRGDKVFAGLSLGSGVFVVVLIAAIAVFLLDKASPALRHNGFGIAGFFTHKDFSLTPLRFGVAGLAFGTLITSVIALLIAVPVALGLALFTTEYAPRRVSRSLGALADLLAAVPSVVYGFWGALFLTPHLDPFQHWLGRWLGWIPIFDVPKGATLNQTWFTGGLVLAIMMLPIVAAISREVFYQVPQADKEAALALGATKLEMIRTAILPRSRGGVMGAAMLGLGRALGETIAVALVLGGQISTSLHILAPGGVHGGGVTIAQQIANQSGEAADNLQRGALIAAGLVLFVITFAVNFVARWIVARTGLKEGTTA